MSTTYYIHAGISCSTSLQMICKTAGAAKRSACARSKKEPGVKFSVFGQPDIGALYLDTVYLNGVELTPEEVRRLNAR